VTEKPNQGTPLIDPNQVKSVLHATPVEAPESVDKNQRKKQPTAAELKPGQFCWGTGRRKKSIARVRLRPGSGKITVNERELTNYFPNVQAQSAVLAPLTATKSEGRYDVFIDVEGGGLTGQAGAAKLGIARALMAADPDTYGPLKNTGYLTRDSRMKERKKYGRRGARRRFQFSKR